MQLLYRNVDGLDVSFQGSMPHDVLETLTEGKARAQQQRQEALVELGPKRIPVHVAESGMRGGYAFRFDTGPFGATWMVADSLNPDRWNLRASVHSLALAQYGYEGVKGQLLAFLDDICAFGQGDDLPSERVSRFDFCVDIATPFFQPVLDHFVCHSRMTKEMYHGLEGQTVARGRRVETVMIGKMPGRQVILYDKTREIIKHEKPYWWDFWGLDKRTFPGEVWRIEVRVGKEELDTWNVRSFGHLEHVAAYLILSTLDAIRYTVPTNDSEPCRWPDHPLWSIAREAAETALATYSSVVTRGKVLEILRTEAVEHFRSLFPGLLASYGHLRGFRAEDMPAIIAMVGNEVCHYAERNPKAMADKFRRAAERYALLR